MTGIMDPGHLGTKPEFSDDVQQRYEKMCRIVGEFAVMQVGVCTFHAAPGGGFVARPFNFYVFPDRQSKTRITMYSDTAAFHVDNHMDFTKWYCGGVPFMTEADHAAAKARAVEPAGAAPAGGSPRPPLTITRASDKVLVDGAMERVRAWEAAAAAGSGDAAGSSCHRATPSCGARSASVSRPSSPSSPSRAARSRGATATASSP